jgi:Rod binding domain-containing protein
MKIPLLQSPVKAADLPLDSLAASGKISESEKIAEVTRQFEAILLRQILQSARKPMFQSKADGDSAASSVYRDMVTDQLAEAISKDGGFGLARSLQVQLAQQISPASGEVPKNKTVE